MLSITNVLLECFNSFSVWNFASTIWLIAVDQHLRFLIPDLIIELYQLVVNAKQYFHNHLHIHSKLPNLFCPRSVTRGFLSVNRLIFSPMKLKLLNIPDFSLKLQAIYVMFILASLLYVKLQKFKLGANALFVGYSQTLIDSYSSTFKYLSI